MEVEVEVGGGEVALAMLAIQWITRLVLIKVLHEAVDKILHKFGLVVTVYCSIVANWPPNFLFHIALKTSGTGVDIFVPHFTLSRWIAECCSITVPCELTFVLVTVVGEVASMRVTIPSASLAWFLLL